MVAKKFIEELKGKIVNLAFPTDAGIQCTIWNLKDYDGEMLKVETFEGRTALINCNCIVEAFEATEDEIKNAKLSKEIKDGKKRIGTMFG